MHKPKSQSVIVRVTDLPSIIITKVSSYYQIQKKRLLSFGQLLFSMYLSIIKCIQIQYHHRLFPLCRGIKIYRSNDNMQHSPEPDGAGNNIRHSPEPDGAAKWEHKSGYLLIRSGLHQHWTNPDPDWQTTDFIPRPLTFFQRESIFYIYISHLSP